MALRPHDILPSGTLLGTDCVLERPLPDMSHPERGVLAWVGRKPSKSLRVSITVLTGSSNPKALQRCEVVIAATSRLDDPCIQRIIEVGRTPTRPQHLYAVSMLLAGRTMSTHIARYGALDRPRCLKLFMCALSGLAKAHRKGIAHGQLTLDNFFLKNPSSASERLVLTGFGRAHLDERTGPPRRLSDVQQMCRVLVAMLTGRISSGGALDLSALEAQLTGDMTLTQALHLGELGAVLEQALSNDPDRRFAHAGQLLDALRVLEGFEDPNATPIPQPAHTHHPGPDALIGQVLAGVYEVGGQIGSGGFAVVYEGRQRGIDRPVAIKVLTENAVPSQREIYAARFMQEAQAAARIEHPNVVNIHHFGLIEGTRQPYMVMELLKGRDLETELIDEGSMSPSRAMNLIGGVLDALGEAHKLGIVHKDLKPSNLFIIQGRRGRELLKITDFGIARLVDEPDAQLTGDGRPVCTPGYAAPEYLQELLVTPALDIYQIGIVLVEMLTGEPLINEETVMQCVARHITGDLRIPPWLLDSHIGPVLRKATAKNYRDRYTSADDFLDDLTQVDSRRIRTRPVSPTG